MAPAEIIGNSSPSYSVDSSLYFTTQSSNLTLSDDTVRHKFDLCLLEAAIISAYFLHVMHNYCQYYSLAELWIVACLFSILRYNISMSACRNSSLHLIAKSFPSEIICCLMVLSVICSSSAKVSSFSLFSAHFEIKAVAPLNKWSVSIRAYEQ